MQLQTKEKQNTNERKGLGALFIQTSCLKIISSVKKISAAFKPTKEDLNLSRWQELEFRNDKPSDLFNQPHDRRFK